MQVSISVIVPIYNVSEYLRCCLDSLYSQTVQPVEVILVNDGSTDDSLAVCHQYQQEHANTVVIDKPNGGLSDARNAGIEVATGKYIYFADSDDWMAICALSELYNFATKHNCEIVQGGFYYAYDKYLLYDDSLSDKVSPIILSKDETMQALIENKQVKNFAWGKLYETDIIKKHPFKKDVYFEDSYWQHLVVDEITRYGIIPTPIYYYRQRNDAISGGFSLRSLDLLKGYEERLSFIKMKYPQYKNLLLNVYWNVLYSFYTLSKSHKDNKVKKGFEDYWIYTQKKYGSDFDIALKDSLRYYLVKNNSALLPCYLWGKRIYDRLTSPYKRIAIR